MEHARFSGKGKKKRWYVFKGTVRKNVDKFVDTVRENVDMVGDARRKNVDESAKKDVDARRKNMWQRKT